MNLLMLFLLTNCFSKEYQSTKTISTLTKIVTVVSFLNLEKDKTFILHRSSGNNLGQSSSIEGKWSISNDTLRLTTKDQTLTALYKCVPKGIERLTNGLEFPYKMEEIVK